jgi:hypothetical protein
MLRLPLQQVDVAALELAHVVVGTLPLDAPALYAGGHFGKYIAVGQRWAGGAGALRLGGEVVWVRALCGRWRCALCPDCGGPQGADAQHGAAGGMYPMHVDLLKANRVAVRPVNRTQQPGEPGARTHLGRGFQEIGGLKAESSAVP